ncbi:MAG: tetratricopeptide repeat protein [Patescibacteria group bacterium]|uniref:Tetratricopeptide repeat protein n=1 Tax=candidate division WWE3 bacterium TaxID=2053526 RepID=A0A955ECP7_UNCKA|nr:tetratricopeptide repeat protein [candidate division WWE3 bacterium]
MKIVTMGRASRKKKLNRTSLQNYNSESVKPYYSDLLHIKDFKDVISFIKTHAGFLFILVLISVFIYGKSLYGEFVSDDIPVIVRNPEVYDFFLALKTFQFYTILRSLTYLIFGMYPFGFHLTSFLLHLVNIVLVLVVVSVLFGKRIAFYSSVLFTVHPVIVEPVVWISALFYLFLAAIFFISVLSLYLYRNTMRSFYLYLIYGLFASFFIFTRWAWSLTFVPMLLIVDQFFLSTKLSLSRLKDFVPLIFMSLVFLLPLYGATSSRVAELQSIQKGERSNYILTSAYTAANQVMLYVYPNTLTLYREGNALTNLELSIIYTLVVLEVICIVWLYVSKPWKHPNLLTKWQYLGLVLFALVSILPAFSPIQVAWFIAERYLYLTVIAYSVILVSVFLYYESMTNIKNYTLILVILLSVCWGVRSHVRANDWITRKSFWLATARVVPRSPRVHNNLGDVYALEKDYTKAIEAFSYAIYLNPDYAEALHNLGFTYLQVGDYANAKYMFNLSLERNPNLYQSLLKLAVISSLENDYVLANSYVDRARVFAPTDPQIDAVLKLIEQHKHRSK